ncbi:hypothetical protein CVT26_004100 [Gymnopilus dilepis]|uniref:Integrase catalytic domain-containing protein n=1 Tax=Gymnopilus dilepis TaxID=231916 RepID=A0A409WYD4_9AGAR|nr:hypothetical protein CVT26_004100 [Gymnopilus dilepis]
MLNLQSTSSTDSSPLGDVSGSSEDDSSALDDANWFTGVGDDAHEFDDVEWDAVEENSPACSGFSTPSFIDTDYDSDEVLVATEPAKPGQYAFVGTSKAELYDLGCTKRLSPFREDFGDFAEIPAKAFNAANKQKFSAIGKGEMVVDVPNGADISKLQLTEVLYSPEVGYTLISLVIMDPDSVKVGEVPRTAKGLYRLEHEGEEANPAEETLTLDQFHRRMGHISPFIARKLVDNGFVTGVRLESMPSGEPFFCKSCVYAKATRKSIPKQREGERAKEFGGEVHSNVWGPSPVESKGGKRYYITFTDDCTRLTHIYLLAQKSEAFQSYKDYEAWVDTQLGAKVKVLHSDRGGEYMGKELTLYLNSKGTAQKLNVHDTSQHLGVAERLPVGRGSPPCGVVDEQDSTKALDGMTLYEAAFGKKPDLRGLREWGEKVWVRVEAGNKLGGRVREGRWTGVDERSKGVRIYWPETRSVSVERNVYYDESSTSRLEGEEREIGVKADADSPINPRPSAEFSQESTSNPTSAQESGPSITENPSITPGEPLTDVEEFISEVETRPKRARKPAQKVQDPMDGTAVAAKGARSQKAAMRGLQVPPKEASAPPADVPEPSKNAENQVFEGEAMSAWIMVGEGDEEYGLAAEISEAEALEPRNVREARRRPDWPLWEKAIQEELDVLKGAGTWEMADTPANANIVGSK